MTEEGPGLDLYDANGNLRASLGVSAEGPALRLWDAMTEQGLSLMVDKDGPVVCLREVKGNTGVMVTAGKVGPAICLSDANGKHRLILDVSPFESGTPGLTMRNANGMATVVVRTLEDGPSVGLFDPANEHGNTAVRLQVDSDGPSLRCLKDGKVLWSAT
ncbi:MAG TPA: hypothetical protein VGR03_12840 [Candidatus Acidoferrum sp.]|nr:hypothetical protein [Candidatus Acidoferrum sp.]